MYLFNLFVIVKFFGCLECLFDRVNIHVCMDENVFVPATYLSAWACDMLVNLPEIVLCKPFFFLLICLNRLMNVMLGYVFL